MEAVDDTLHNEDAKDPAATRKRLTDAFYSQGVMPDQVAALLGHPLESMTPAELTLLRTIYTALKDGETTWAEAMATFGPKANGEAPAVATKGNAGLRAAMKRKPVEEVQAAESDADMLQADRELAEQEGAQ